VNVELTPDELALIVSALKADASRWAAEWARADELPSSSQARLWQQVVQRHELAVKLEWL
jgi:hypothetical protein